MTSGRGTVGLELSVGPVRGSGSGGSGGRRGGGGGGGGGGRGASREGGRVHCDGTPEGERIRGKWEREKHHYMKTYFWFSGIISTFFFNFLFPS